MSALQQGVLFLTIKIFILNNMILEFSAYLNAYYVSLHPHFLVTLFEIVIRGNFTLKSHYLKIFVTVFYINIFFQEIRYGPVPN